MIQHIGVIGAGTMGIGIAQVAASQGCIVHLFDANQAQVSKAISNLDAFLLKRVEKGKLQQADYKQLMSHIVAANTLNDLAESQLVIEAIVEKKEIKQQVFLALEKIVAEDCILASNTSSISITSLSACLAYPGRFLGIHFFNPAPLMPLVEIIPGLLTDRTLMDNAYTLIKSWGKTPVVANDIPGFIVNRIARPFYGEALRIVEEHIATPEQVDDAMRTIGNFKMGPFELMDLIGVNVNFSVTQTVYKDYFFDPKYKPSLLQQRMSEAGLHGRKSGKGFFSYANDAVAPTPERDDALYQKIFMRVIAMLINEAVEMKRLQLASDNDIELAMQKGVNYPKGLLAWGAELGYANVAAVLQDLYNMYQEERYRQSPLLKNWIRIDIITIKQMIMTPNEIVDYMLEKDQYSQLLGIKVLDIKPHYALLEMPIKAQMLNGLGTVHGGVTFSLADSAFAFSANNNGDAAVALNVSINFSKAGREGDVFRAESNLVTETRKTALYSIKVTNQHNELVALFTGTVYRVGKKVMEL